jgi:hypothetical protein
MSTSPPSPPGDHEPGGPSFAEENAMRVASESLIHYDAGSDTYHCSYGPPIPAITINDRDRGVLVRVEPRTGQVVGFSIPEFRTWHTEHADEDGSFDVELPAVWPLVSGLGASDEPAD